jgi:hypothetical protein
MIFTTKTGQVACLKYNKKQNMNNFDEVLPLLARFQFIADLFIFNLDGRISRIINDSQIFTERNNYRPPHDQKRAHF